MRRHTLAVTMGAVSSFLSAVILENPEAVPAAIAAMTYEHPEDGDIVPDETGCALPQQHTVDWSLLAPSRRTPLPSFKAIDEKKLGTADSASHKFTTAEPRGYAAVEPMYSIDGTYFDTHVTTFMTQFGTTFEVYKHAADRNFTINPHELERMVNDIFTHSELYSNPQLKALMQCGYEAFMNGELSGKTIEVDTVAQGNKKFTGTNVVTIDTEYRMDAPTIGLGIGGLDISVYGVELAPYGVMMVAGGNGELVDSEYHLNRRFMHELMHVLLFHDVVSTVRELDEQERAVQYFTKLLEYYYEKNDNLPHVIQLQ